MQGARAGFCSASFPIWEPALQEACWCQSRTKKQPAEQEQHGNRAFLIYSFLYFSVLFKPGVEKEKATDTFPQWLLRSGRSIPAVHFYLIAKKCWLRLWSLGVEHLQAGWQAGLVGGYADSLGRALLRWAKPLHAKRGCAETYSPPGQMWVYYYEIPQKAYPWHQHGRFAKSQMTAPSLEA